MPSFKPAYLIHGDDHGRIAERRSRLRAMAEAESGAEGVEVFEGEEATPERVAAALAAMTLVPGRRFVIVDGAERFKPKELEPLVGVLGALHDDTTVAFFAREDGRTKAPSELAGAVRDAGGDVAAENTLKPWQLPKWTAARAREMGIELEPGAARALVDHVGDRQQRILRELERVALELGPDAHLDAEQVGELTAGSAERRLWDLADAMLAGDAAGAARIYLELASRGERITGVVYALARRLRDALEVAAKLGAGASDAQVKKELRGPRDAREAVVRGARRLGPERLREGLATLADLELGSRGGGEDAPADDSAALRAITAIAG